MFTACVNSEGEFEIPLNGGALKLFSMSVKTLSLALEHYDFKAENIVCEIDICVIHASSIKWGMNTTEGMKFSQLFNLAKYNKNGIE